MKIKAKIIIKQLVDNRYGDFNIQINYNGVLFSSRFCDEYEVIEQVETPKYSEVN